MININIEQNSEFDGVFVIISNNPHSKQSNWKSELAEWAKSNKKIIFKIKEIDNDGLVFLVTNYWLELNDNIFVIPNEEWHKEALKSMYGTQVIFVEKLSGCPKLKYEN